jgi:L-threonylcarbamoyladenylate synthase
VTDVFRLDDPAQRAEGFEQAKEALAGSGLVVMPTDTVYGLAADAFDAVAVRRLLRAKGRGRDMPTPVLIGTGDTLRALATNVTADTRALAAAFWPGALTIVCRQQPTLQWDIGDSRGTVALRVPDHADTIDLLLDTGPLAVSSANISGAAPATTIDEAREMLKDAVDVYLDGGSMPGLVPSTIVDATGDVIRVLRLGVITLQQLREVVPDLEGPDEPESFEAFASPEEPEPEELEPEKPEPEEQQEPDDEMPGGIDDGVEPTIKPD